MGRQEQVGLSPTSLTSSQIAASLARRLPFFYGWVVVYIGFLVVFLMGTTSFWGLPVFIGPMTDDTGWSRASIFLGLTLRFIVGAFGGLLLGRFADRRGGPSRLLLIGVLLDAGSLWRCAGWSRRCSSSCSTASSVALPAPACASPAAR
jgi:hypothetical protein